MVDLQQFWNSKVPKGHKHFSNVMPKEKIEILTKRFRNHVVDQLDTEQIVITLDWGCGGGLMTKIVTEFSEVILLDISQESLQTAADYISVIANDSILYDGTTVIVDVDLIICYSVIHHFPNLKYWQTVAENWKTIKPKFLAIPLTMH